jgi:hypothetical protein
MLLWLKPGRSCDRIACLSGVHFLTGVTINHVATLKGGGGVATSVRQYRQGLRVVLGAAIVESENMLRMMAAM